MRPIHDRMPVILRREDEEQWLDVSGARFEEARSVLKPYPPEQMDAHDVSTLVNKPENDTAECIQPLLGEETPAPQLSLLWSSLAGFGNPKNNRDSSYSETKRDDKIHDAVPDFKTMQVFMGLSVRIW